MEKVLYDIWANGGSPVVVGLLLFGYMKMKFNSIEKSITDLTTGKTWKETCNERHDSIDKIIEQIRHKVFNGKDN